MIEALIIGVLAIAATWDVFRRRTNVATQLEATHKRIEEVAAVATGADNKAQNILGMIADVRSSHATKLTSVGRAPRFG